MPYSAITIIFIVLATVVAAFVRRRKRDKCLKDFSQNMVTLEETTGNVICGKLSVENTGLKFTYPAGCEDKDKQGSDETSRLEKRILWYFAGTASSDTLQNKSAVFWSREGKMKKFFNLQ